MVNIDLSGTDGNAFALMGYAKKFSRQLKLNDNVIIQEMMSGDYENLLEVFQKHFGDYVTLNR